MTITLPPDSVRHKSCEQFFRPAQKSDVCHPCLSLKYNLTHKSSNVLSPEDHLRCQSIHSTVPIDYLSPDNRSKRIRNMRNEMEILRQKLRPCNKSTTMDLEDKQNEEMAQFVQSISDSDNGLSEQSISGSR